VKAQREYAQSPERAAHIDEEKEKWLARIRRLRDACEKKREVEMTYDELLKAITPLPWSEDVMVDTPLPAKRIVALLPGQHTIPVGHVYQFVSNQSEGKANAEYLVLAANLLPEMVEALEIFMQARELAIKEGYEKRSQARFSLAWTFARALLKKLEAGNGTL